MRDPACLDGKATASRYRRLFELDANPILGYMQALDKNCDRA
jgi:hypothetical protein